MSHSDRLRKPRQGVYRRMVEHQDGSITIEGTGGTVHHNDALRKAIETMEQVLWGYDWLGTGSSQRLANEEEREAWDAWTVIRVALGAGEPDDRP